VRVGVALLVVAGCDYTFQIDRVQPSLRDAPSDCSAFDDFTGTRLATVWTTFQGDAAFKITQDEVLKIDLSAAPMSAPGEAGVRYGASFEMPPGASVEIEVPKVIDPHPNIENYMRLRATGDNSQNYTIRYGDGQIDFRSRSGSDTIHRMRAHDAAQDRFWRISRGPEADQVSFWTRGNGEAWFLETTQDAAVSFADMEVLLVAGTYNNGSTAPGFVLYDSLKVCGAMAL
jgi:hypothetical protein